MSNLPKPESKADQEAMQAALSGLLHDDPAPDDEQVHKLGEQLGVDPDKIEETAYKMLSTATKDKPGKHRGKPAGEFDAGELAAGVKIEREHTDDPTQAREIAKDHLAEIPDYYTRLTAMEREAKKSLTHGQGEVAVLPITKHEGAHMLQDWLVKARDAQGTYDNLDKGDLTPEKARKILHDGEVQGHSLTEQQRKYFGAVAGGSAVQKSDQATWDNPQEPRKKPTNQAEPEQPAQKPAGPSEEELIGDVSTEGIENPATTIEGHDVLEAGENAAKKGIIQTPMTLSQDPPPWGKSLMGEVLSDWLKAQQLGLFGPGVAGHKYTKRTGSPGHYQYTYPDDQGQEHKFDQATLSPDSTPVFYGPKGSTVWGKPGAFHVLHGPTTPGGKNPQGEPPYKTMEEAMAAAAAGPKAATKPEGRPAPEAKPEQPKVATHYTAFKDPAGYVNLTTHRSKGVALDAYGGAAVFGGATHRHIGEVGEGFDPVKAVEQHAKDWGGKVGSVKDIEGKQTKPQPKPEPAKAPEAKPAEPEKPKATGGPETLPKGGHIHREGGEVYGDSAMLQSVNQLGAGFEVKHLGFGEFEVKTPKGTVQFNRRDEKDFEGKSGRAHLLDDDTGGEAVKALITALGGSAGGETKKSMSGLAGLEDYMRKSNAGLPTGEPGFSQGVEVAKPKDGGQLEGVGHTGADTNHTSAETTIGDVPRGGEKLLSADDAAAAEAMKLHKKPLEESVTKSIGYTQQEGSHVYNGTRQLLLQKAEREQFAAEHEQHTGPIERPELAPDPIVKGRTWRQGSQAVAVYSDQADRECFEMLKGDGFYQDGGPVGQLRKAQIDQVDLCKACHEAKPAYLTACPHCGDNTTMNRVVPADLGGEMLEKSERSQLRLRETEADVYAPDGIEVDE